MNYRNIYELFARFISFNLELVAVGSTHFHSNRAVPTVAINTHFRAIFNCVEEQLALHLYARRLANEKTHHFLRKNKTSGDSFTGVFPRFCVSYVKLLRVLIGSLLCPSVSILILRHQWLNKNQFGKRYLSDLYFRRSRQKIGLQ